MSDAVRLCGLSGCDNVIVVVPGAPTQKYCCARHRKLAWRQRLGDTAQEPGLPSSEPLDQARTEPPRPAVEQVKAPPEPCPSVPLRRLVPEPGSSQRRNQRRLRKLGRQHRPPTSQRPPWVPVPIPPAAGASTWWTLCVGAPIVVAQGYGVTVYCLVFSSLLADPGAGTRGVVSLSTVVVVAMLVGALSWDGLCGRFGRRPVAITAGVWSMTWTGACALFTAGWPLVTCAALGGLGIGIVLIGVVTLAAAPAPGRRGWLVAAVLTSGVPVGGVLAALLGVWILPRFGWRPMFGVGAIIAAVGVAVMLAAALRRRGPRRREGGRVG